MIHQLSALNFTSHNNLQISNFSLRCTIYFMSLIPYDMFWAICPSSDNTTYNPLGDINIMS
jgi:hypothetical protein